jgi:hypothetical protein
MPDGSPNKFVASVNGILEGQEREMAENGKVTIGIGPLTITPLGMQQHQQRRIWKIHLTLDKKRIQASEILKIIKDYKDKPNKDL